MDSGCSGHMTGSKFLLSEFEKKVVPTMSYGDGNKGQTLGYENIIIENVIIKDVALVEGLKHNLLCGSEICDKGYYVGFLESQCEVISKSTKKIVLIEFKHGNIYEANLNLKSGGPVTYLLSKALVEESSNWHKRLSQLNFSNLNEVVKKDLVRRLPKVQFVPDGLLLTHAKRLSKERLTSKVKLSSQYMRLITYFILIYLVK